MCTNAKGINKWYFPASLYDGDNAHHPGISLRIPPPINIANVCYHSLLGDSISFLVSNPLEGANSKA